MKRKRAFIIGAVAIIAIAVAALLVVPTLLPKSPEATDAASRVALLRYDDDSASFIITRTGVPGTLFDNGTVYMAVNGNNMEPLFRTVNWTGSSSTLAFRYDNATFLMLIEDLDGNKKASNDDKITIIALERFAAGHEYSFWFYEPDITTPYIFGTFKNLQ